VSTSWRVPYVDFPAQFAGEKEELMNSVLEVFERGDFILGDKVVQFEREFAQLCGVKHAVSVANGTDSLILALRALDIGSGDEVITASNSWISSAAAIALVGARPVFVDVTSDQNIDPALIERSITPKTKAIMPIHLTGRCARMPEIMKIADKHKLPVIEDAAQAVMSHVGGKRSGSFGKINSFSLHPLKNLNAAGDAGILTTNDDELAVKLKMLRHHGMKNREEVAFWGYNSRLDTLQAAILLPRIKKLESVIERRRRNAKIYLSGLAGVVELPVEREDEFHTYHVFVIQCDRRNELQSHLMKAGIDTKIHYPIPIHRQEAAAYLGYGEGSLPVTERQAKRILSLPIHQNLDEKQLHLVVNTIKEFYEHKRTVQL
jgi:dTDP-4-amino-4,6-dideoxygalactose transaminase